MSASRPGKMMAEKGLPSVSRRRFLETAGVLGLSGVVWPAYALSDESTERIPGRYRPGRIDNDYSLVLPAEQAALKTPPAVTSVTHDSVTAQLKGQSLSMRSGDQFEGWCLLGIVSLDGSPTAIFEKHVSHRGAIAYVSARDGLTAYIPKAIGQLANIRPRPIQTPHGVKLVRAASFEPGRPDVTGQYILNSAEDPCYENVAALGAEYIGWTLVANEAVGPQGSLYLDATGRSRQIAEQDSIIEGLNATSAEGQRVSGLWAPDATGAVFDPIQLSSVGWIAQDTYEYVPGYSKRTLLGGYLPVADIGVWNPTHGAGYEVMVVLPPGDNAKPIGRLRFLVSKDTVTQLRSDEEEVNKNPEFFSVIDELALNENRRTIVTENGQTYCINYWNGTAESFYTALASTWRRWHDFHDQAMQVDIPDEWLRDAAQAGLTLSRCSYRGLEPTYQIGEGGYTAFRKMSDCAKGPDRDIAFSDALFPVAHYEFVWAHQLWNHVREGDRYFQHYLDHYILPDGDFVYNTQDQVEAPLNIGVFLANSARSYFYSRDLAAFEKRLSILERMIRLALDRYEYSKAKFPTGDPRRGLIWGSPEADLGSPRKNGPEDHPYYYQNAAWIWRGLVEHARALAKASEDSKREEFAISAAHYREIAREMRALIETSIADVCASRNSEMKAAGVTPFRPDDTDRKATHLTDYENHRFMEDWLLCDWGDPELDLGHLKHRELSGRQVLGLPLSHGPAVTSNFMVHGTLSALIRKEDYRPFLLTLYALVCYTADCGNRYSPEDAAIPGGHPLEGPPAFWSAVVNSTLQPTLGLRWLLCYEETDNDICHLQKAAPKHWFAKGETIAVRNCPTRFGSIEWSTHAVEDRQWSIIVNVPKGFVADLVIHVHPNDGLPLRATSFGLLRRNKIVISRAVMANVTSLRLIVS